MMKATKLAEAVVVAVASGLGILIAVIDLVAPFGDDSSKLTILLWLLASGSLGFAIPRRPWRWAMLVGPWLTLIHLLAHALGLPDSIHPNTNLAILLLLPVSLAVCSVGAYGGALARRLVAQPGLC
jgi:hypothetical protein